MTEFTLFLVMTSAFDISFIAKTWPVFLWSTLQTFPKPPIPITYWKLNDPFEIAGFGYELEMKIITYLIQKHSLIVFYSSLLWDSGNLKMGYCASSEISLNWTTYVLEFFSSEVPANWKWSRFLNEARCLARKNGYSWRRKLSPSLLQSINQSSKKWLAHSLVNNKCTPYYFKFLLLDQFSKIG